MAFQKNKKGCHPPLCLPIVKTEERRGGEVGRFQPGAASANGAAHCLEFVNPEAWSL